MTLKPARLLAIVFTLAIAAPAFAADPAPADAPKTASMQGGQQAWINDPHTHALYQLTVAAFANGPANVDAVKFKQDAYAIFRDFGRTTGMGADAMVDHLKLIPDQLIQIATEDPKVLDSYDRFIAAVFGPQ
jgi:hypothetical protein